RRVSAAGLPRNGLTSNKVTSVKASTMLRRDLAAARGHFIATYARACRYQLVAASARRLATRLPDSGSNGSPAFIALISSARAELASAFVRNSSSNDLPSTDQRTRYQVLPRIVRLPTSQTRTSKLLTRHHSRARPATH